MSTSKIIRKTISTAKAPTPIGPYSQAVLVDRTLYLSGMLGVDPKTQKLVDGNAVAQARQALINIKNILEEAGSSLEKVVKTTILLNNLDDFGGINEVYKEFFTANYPSRSTYQVAKLPLGAQLEIEAIAVTGEVSKM
ncbi:2-iminobutanoate/2-iminopropanoate deaminase isoform X2 [Odontomachus brunneus]|uniref:2-iminobutanoate/2-iminopropanoate deaminase isoform X2 n=1 Tax=Odontomachus brunneus TaxID=486640 RepID=UPI0013F20464|nr:2-iminobutanoate/2-iminopropanoate deaminase isoform X2 [Odontomachus brunneus]